MSEALIRDIVRTIIEGLDVGYIGIVLDHQSRKMLLEYIPPVHENITADHVTLIHNPSTADLELFDQNEPVYIKVTSQAVDENAQAVVVQVPKHFMGLAQREPHITISTASGVQQSYSNELIKHAHESTYPLVLRGYVKFVSNQHMPYNAGTGYRSGRGVGAGAFAPKRTQQGVPMQPVPMSGQTGMPQGPHWSIADAIMSQTYGDEIDKDKWKEDEEGEEDENDVADWDEWNTPRYDVERFYQQETVEKNPVRTREKGVSRAVKAQRRYLEMMCETDERLLRQYIRTMLEVNAISTGGGAGVSTGNVAGVVTPMGTGPTHPKKSDKRGAKKRTKKRMKISAENFGGGEFDDQPEQLCSRRLD